MISEVELREFNTGEAILNSLIVLWALRVCCIKC